ncbi:hypothetical protein LSH36_63g05070 [Paralvinella palmiformis]|uniref:Uncharacterized protein n=1 Tax=Paralvinella palmiformis TaxID=53620 RepID=A0AAD9NC13_9ANNE|nr:hypothetical protein LSH36_63g05070 [Paralvinella palmiformis]
MVKSSKRIELSGAPSRGIGKTHSPGTMQSSSTMIRWQGNLGRISLQLILNIDQDEYIKETGDTAGARLVVHTQNSMPFPEDEGITVTPGQATSIGVKQLRIKRLAEPYGNCLTLKERNASRNAYQLLFPVAYRPTACSKTCYQHNVIEECHCKDPYYPINDEAYGVSNLTICRTANVSQDDCRYEVTKKFERNELECYCPNSCDEVIFVLSASTAEWPSDVQKSSILSRFYSKAPSLFLDPTDPEKYKRNLLKVEVFYEEFNFELMQENAAYYTSNYLSDVGGVLGLWLGCSILTLIEFVELIMDVLAVCLMRRRCRLRRQTSCTRLTPNTSSNAVKVAPSPSPIDNSDYSVNKRHLGDNYFISKSSKFDMDMSELPKAFRSYIEETKLEQAEIEMSKRQTQSKK